MAKPFSRPERDAAHRDEAADRLPGDYTHVEQVLDQTCKAAHSNPLLAWLIGKTTGFWLTACQVTMPVFGG